MFTKLRLFALATVLIAFSIFQGSILGIPANATAPTCYTVVSGVLTDGSACTGDVVIDSSVRVIGQVVGGPRDQYGSFQSSRITSITIPASVTEIRYGAFWYSTLSTVNFENGSTLATIGLFAFANTPNLKNITLPSTLTSISGVAFAGSRVRNIAFQGAAPSVVRYNADGLQNITGPVIAWVTSGNEASFLAQSPRILSDIRVGSPAPAIYSPVSNDTLDGTVGTAFSQKISYYAYGGPGTTISSGVLPGGLTLSSTGLISGTPTTAGSNSVSFTVTDSTTATAVITGITFRIAAAFVPVVYVAPTPVAYLKTLTSPKLNIQNGKLMCTAGTYNSGYTLDGVIQGSATALFSPPTYIYNLLLNGVAQTSLSVTTSNGTASWNTSAVTPDSLVTCSVTVAANSLTNTDKSSDNSSAVSSALSTQSAAIAAANATYASANSANTKAYQKALIDNRTAWRAKANKVRSDYYAELDRIKSLGATKNARALTSAALKTYIAAQKKSAADYKASGPAALAAKDVADKAALDAKTAAIAKANSAFGTAIESIGYGVLIP